MIGSYINAWLTVKGRKIPKILKHFHSDGEARCLRRSDLIEALANALPPETIRYGYQVMSVNMERSSSYSVLQLHDGNSIKAKVIQLPNYNALMCARDT